MLTRKEGSLFELDSSLKFDLILFFGVYYHLKDPLKGFQAVAKKLNPGGLLLFEGLVRAGNKPVLHQFRESEIEPTTFCSANIAWLTASFHNAGLERVGGDNELQESAAQSYRQTRLGSRVECRPLQEGVQGVHYIQEADIA